MHSMFDPERAEAEAREADPLLDEAYKKAEKALGDYITPLVDYFCRLENEVAEMNIAQRFSRAHGPNFDYAAVGIPNPMIVQPSEADYKRADLLDGVHKAKRAAMSVGVLIKSIVMDMEATKQEDIIFEPGNVLGETANYRVVMGWKPGLEGQGDGQRFFIEPKTDAAEQMLRAAAKAHNIPNFNMRDVNVDGVVTSRECLRADYNAVNLGPLLLGRVVVPAEGADSVPAPDRLEECLRDHPGLYTFKD